MNGIELLKKIIVERGPPVCIMTSYADSHARMMAQSCGAAGFLEKPIGSGELLAFIASSSHTS